MRTIVFGGTGWVGHHIVRAFHVAGHEVTTCSRGMKATHQDDIPKGMRMVRADKTDQSAVASVLQEPYDVIIDSVPTEASVDNIVRHARGLSHYIHCSSTGGYAPLPFIPADETAPYAHVMGWRQKAAVDAKVTALCRQEGFPATVVRPCYITGPGLLPLDNMGGRREDFIPDILEGRVLDLPNDGQALLQPIHVRDLGRAFLLAAGAPGSVGEVYNICLEKAVTIAKYLEVNAAALGREAKISYLPLEAMVEKHGKTISERGLRFFATHMCFDIRKAREQLGYVPEYATVEAIQETARWAAEQPGARDPRLA